MTEDLRRFRALIAEIEGESNLCPKCDNTLVKVPLMFNLTDVGGVAACLRYRYCEQCNLYFMHGARSEDK